MHPSQIQYVNEPLADILGLAGRELVSLVGAGGKTTLMFALAEELAFSGQRVLVTTTTHIFRPSGEVLMVPDPGDLAQRLGGRPLPGESVILAKGEKPTEYGAKLFGHEPEVIDALWLDNVAEYVLVEADGSKRRPLKAPREREPVIPDQTTVVAGLIGMNALGQVADEENVFGFREFQQVTGIRPGEIIGPEQAAALICHEQGLFKSTPLEAKRAVFLNQAESEQARLAGLDVIRILGREKFRGRVVLGSLQNGLYEVFLLEG